MTHRTHHGYDPVHDLVQPTYPHRRAEQNTLSDDGAAVLVESLDQFWHSRGYPDVHHWVDHGNTKHHGRFAVVRSNLVNGLPPKVHA